MRLHAHHAYAPPEFSAVPGKAWVRGTEITVTVSPALAEQPCRAGGEQPAHHPGASCYPWDGQTSDCRLPVQVGRGRRGDWHCVLLLLVDRALLVGVDLLPQLLAFCCLLDEPRLALLFGHFAEALEVPV